MSKSSTIKKFREWIKEERYMKIEYIEVLWRFIKFRKKKDKYNDNE